MTGFHIQGHGFVAKSATPGLYIVSTPIGNLADITLRALETLAGVDLILAEDTRVTRGLLAHYGIKTPLRAHHRHSGPAALEPILAELAAGRSIALVSDAGTPLLSDPGEDIVAAAIAAGQPVSPVPGASALLASLAGADFDVQRFRFEGFLPAKAGERRQRLRALATSDCPVVLYEAPHRLAASLADARDILGERPALVARELTKLFETFRRGSLGALARHYGEAEQPRGEIVIVIAPAGPEAIGDIDAQLAAKLNDALLVHSVKDAAQIVAAEMGLPRKQVYARAIALRGAAERPA
jgi:16S rRNA (cytidine1402-2'-O)-methyltransferase